MRSKNNKNVSDSKSNKKVNIFIYISSDEFLILMLLDKRLWKAKTAQKNNT